MSADKFDVLDNLQSHDPLLSDGRALVNEALQTILKLLIGLSEGQQRLETKLDAMSKAPRPEKTGYDLAKYLGLD